MFLLTSEKTSCVGCVVSVSWCNGEPPSLSLWLLRTVVVVRDRSGESSSLCISNIVDPEECGLPHHINFNLLLLFLLYMFSENNIFMLYVVHTLLQKDKIAEITDFLVRSRVQIPFIKFVKPSL